MADMIWQTKDAVLDKSVLTLEKDQIHKIKSNQQATNSYKAVLGKKNNNFPPPF